MRELSIRFANERGSRGDALPVSKDSWELKTRRKVDAQSDLRNKAPSALIEIEEGIGGALVQFTQRQIEQSSCGADAYSPSGWLARMRLSARRSRRERLIRPSNRRTRLGRDWLSPG